MGELRAGGVVEVEEGAELGDGGDPDVGEGDALANEEGAGGEVVVEGGEGAVDALEEGGVDLRLVLGR